MEASAPAQILSNHRNSNIDCIQIGLKKNNMCKRMMKNIDKMGVGGRVGGKRERAFSVFV